MINLIVKLILAMLLLTNLSACHVYKGEAIEGWVVDEETKQPIQDAVVVTVWEIYGGTVHGGTVGNLLAQEAVTDARGRYVVKSWGPKFVFWNHVSGTEPGLVVFHKDYYFWMGGNADFKPPAAFTIETRESDWNGKTIALKKVDGNWEQLAQNARIAEYNLHTSSSSRRLRCAWERMPRLSAELLKRAGQLASKGVHNSLLTEEILFRAGKCAEPRSLLEAYK